jgi:hypothetical protein
MNKIPVQRTINKKVDHLLAPVPDIIDIFVLLGDLHSRGNPYAVD